MRISELSRATDVPVATVKYYLREELLPPGRLTGRNQAEYGEEHVRRLRLVRILVEIGGLGIAAVRRIVHALDDDRMPMHSLLGTVQYALVAARDLDDDDARQAANDVDEFLASLGWQVHADAPARSTFAHALAALRRLGYPAMPDNFTTYAEHADQIAAWELAALPDEPRAVVVEMHVLGTVVFGAILTALRQLAEEHHSARRFRAAGDLPPTTGEQRRAAGSTAPQPPQPPPKPPKPPKSPRPPKAASAVPSRRATGRPSARG